MHIKVGCFNPIKTHNNIKNFSKVIVDLLLLYKRNYRDILVRDFIILSYKLFLYRGHTVGKNHSDDDEPTVFNSV